MRYLSVDQSTKRTGYAIFEDDGSALIDWPLVSWGYFQTPYNRAGNDAVLYQADRIIELALRCRISMVLYEGIYMGANVKTAVILSRLQGAMLAHFHLNDIFAFEVSSSDVCSYMRISNRTKREGKKQAALRLAILDLPVSTAEYARALLNGDVPDELEALHGGSFCEDVADAIMIGRAGSQYFKLSDR